MSSNNLTKICTICKEEKVIKDNFRPRKQPQSITYHSWCNDCYSAQHKKYSKNYYDKNSEQRSADASRYAATHRDQVNKKKREVRKKIKNKIHHTISSSINQHIRRHGSSKGGKSTFDFIGYTKDELIYHIENNFESWMTWDNYGNYTPKTWMDNDISTWTWQLDHIIPQSDLPYTSMEDDNFKKCWALSNLRPLSAKQNNIDGARRVRHFIK